MENKTEVTRKPIDPTMFIKKRPLAFLSKSATNGDIKANSEGTSSSAAAKLIQNQLDLSTYYSIGRGRKVLERKRHGLSDSEASPELSPLMDRLKQADKSNQPRPTMAQIVSRNIESKPAPCVEETKAVSLRHLSEPGHDR